MLDLMPKIQFQINKEEDKTVTATSQTLKQQCVTGHTGTTETEMNQDFES